MTSTNVNGDEGADAIAPPAEAPPPANAIAICHEGAEGPPPAKKRKQIAHETGRCTEWRYVNDNVRKQFQTITLFSMDGRVSCVSSWGRTEWHGEFEIDATRGTLDIRFDCHGTARTKFSAAHLIYGTNGRQFHGVDEQGRRLHITKVSEWQWMPVEKAWRQLW